MTDENASIWDHFNPIGEMPDGTIVGNFSKTREPLPAGTNLEELRAPGIYTIRARQEPYCDHGPLDACRCLADAFRLSEEQAAAVGLAARKLYEESQPADAEDMHVYAHEFDPIGGFVCGECGTPTESEPCPEHQPIAYSKIT